MTKVCDFVFIWLEKYGKSQQNFFIVQNKKVNLCQENNEQGQRPF